MENSIPSRAKVIEKTYEALASSKTRSKYIRYVKLDAPRCVGRKSTFWSNVPEESIISVVDSSCLERERAYSNNNKLIDKGMYMGGQAFLSVPFLSVFSSKAYEYKAFLCYKALLCEEMPFYWTYVFIKPPKNQRIPKI